MKDKSAEIEEPASSLEKGLDFLSEGALILRTWTCNTFSYYAPAGESQVPQPALSAGTF